VKYPVKLGWERERLLHDNALCLRCEVKQHQNHQTFPRSAGFLRSLWLRSPGHLVSQNAQTLIRRCRMTAWPKASLTCAASTWFDTYPMRARLKIKRTWQDFQVSFQLCSWSLAYIAEMQMSSHTSHTSHTRHMSHISSVSIVLPRSS